MNLKGKKTISMRVNEPGLNVVFVLALSWELPCINLLYMYYTYIYMFT